MFDRKQTIQSVIFHYNFQGWQVKRVDYDNYIIYFHRIVKDSCFLGLIRYNKTEYKTIHINEYCKPVLIN